MGPRNKWRGTRNHDMRRSGDFKQPILVNVTREVWFFSFSSELCKMGSFLSDLWFPVDIPPPNL
jgi:hypothetical protein